MKFLLLAFILLNTSTAFAQIPQKMSYQAIIRDASNNLLSSKNVGMRVSLIKGDPSNNPIYIETHTSSTNLNGLVSIQIGTGAILKGNFSTIDWSTGPYFIYTETDPDGGFDYRINGSSELLSVPFALFAASTKSTFDSSYLSNRINAKMNINDTALMLSNYSKAGDFVKTSSLQGLDSFNINIKGNMGSSGNVTVAGNIEALGSTSTLGTIDKPFKGLYISSGSLSIASDTLGQNIPAAILSNVRGNLEISAGGLKLNGTDEAFIAPRIVSTLTGNASTATKLQTARTINGILFDGSSNIVLPNTDNNNFAKITQLNGTDSFNINLKGNLVSLGNVTVAGNIEAFGTTSTLGTVDKPFKGLFISSGSLSIASDTLGQNIPAAILSNIGGNLEISAGGLKLNGTNEAFIAARIVSTLTGNASTATKLENAKTINGVLFDGSNDILIPANTQNILSFNNVGTGDVSGVTFDGSVAKTISYNSIGAAPLAGSTLITTVGNLTLGSVPYTLLSGTTPIWNQSTTGNAATVSTNANLNGVVTSIGNTTSITNRSITNNMLANNAVSNLSGINTGDQTIPTLESLGASPIEGSEKLITIGLLDKLTLSSNKSEDQQEILNGSITIHKLSGVGIRQYVLNDGYEGQVIYILPFGERTTFPDITIRVDHGTIWVENTLITGSRERPIIWTPFFDKKPNDTMVTALFSENKWFLLGGTSSY